MRIDPAGWPFIGGAAALAIITAFLVSNALGLALLILALLFLFFFRDPDRAVTEAPNAVLSPTDARVVVAGQSTSQDFAPADWLQISMFLSPMDVHVNRMPVSGRVTKSCVDPPEFLLFRRQMPRPR